MYDALDAYTSRSIWTDNLAQGPRVLTKNKQSDRRDYRVWISNHTNVNSGVKLLIHDLTSTAL